MLRDGKIVIMGKRKNYITKVTAAILLYLQNTVLEPFSLLNCKVQTKWTNTDWATVAQKINDGFSSDTQGLKVNQ